MLAAVLIGALARPVRAAARVDRVGFLRVGPPPPTFVEGFWQGLREHGYLEGKNLVIEYGLARTAAGLPEVVAELLLRKVDVLVASGTPSVLPARKVSGSVPVVFVAAIDPVAAGVASSLAHPGGFVTGVTAMHADVIAKRLGLLKELLPRLARVGVLVRTSSPATGQYVKEAEAAADALGMQVQILSVGDPEDLERAFSAARGVSAVLVADDAVFTAHRARIAALTLKSRLPTIYGFSDMVEAGGLLSYGPHYGDMYRRAASQVHKILRGARPADIPIEQPTRFELVVNLRTARALGLTVPASLLARADQVID
jgi:putative ABC transport system substrate-binding protein